MALNGDELARLDQAVRWWEDFGGSVVETLAPWVDQIAAARVGAAFVATDARVDAVCDALDDHGHNGIDCRPEKPLDYTAERILAVLAKLSARQDDGERSGQ